MKTFYTYLWLREDGIPYYAGKGSDDRAFTRGSHYVPCPPPDRVIVQEWPSEANAFEAEKMLIAFYGRINIGTGCLRNLTDGGEGVSGHKHSDDARRKMSLAQTKEVRKRSSERNTRIFTGKSLTPNHKNKIAATLRGIKRSPEEIKKSVAARTGAKRSDEFKHRRSEHQKLLWQNPEYRQHMRDVHRGIR